jgi:thiol-disulfide isomerase/thioredoxin
METGPDTPPKRPDVTPPPLWLRLLITVVLTAAVWIMLKGWDETPGFWSEQFGIATQSYAPEVQSLAADLPQADSAYLQQVFDSGKPSLAFIFTTWCPHCKRTLPEIAALAQENLPVPLHVIAADRDRYKLADYWTQHPELAAALALHHLPVSSYNELQERLKKAGGTHTTAIPYLAVINSDGKMVAEIPGYVTKDAIISTLKKEGLL